ncbi:hypothetical protein OROGR_024344 [Orobanche gracilis]
MLSLFLLFIATLTSPQGTTILPFYRSVTASYSVFVESKLHPLPVSTLPPPPRIAYLISGSAGDGGAAKLVLLALYHPRNGYVLHLDLEASPEERADLHEFVKGHAVFQRFGNVRMIAKANLVTYRGPTMFQDLLNKLKFCPRHDEAFQYAQSVRKVKIGDRNTALHLFVSSIWKTSSKTISKLAHPNAPLGYGLCFLNLAFDGFTNATQDSLKARVPKDKCLEYNVGHEFMGGPVALDLRQFNFANSIQKLQRLQKKRKAT